MVLVAASDDRLPRKIRLRVLCIEGSPLSAESIELIRAAVLQEDEDDLWSAIRLLSVHPQRGEKFKRALLDERIPLDRRKKIAGFLSQLFPDGPDRSEFIAKCLAELNLQPDLLDIVRLFSARFGDRLAFEQLLEKMGDGQIELAAQAVSLFGHHPGRVLAERAADLAEEHIGDGKDAARLGHAATTGMLYIFEMDFGMGGALRHAAPHAGTGRWMQLVEKWSERDDLGVVQKLELLTSASQLGSIRARDAEGRGYAP